jgi:hypothetical protein
MRVGQREVGRLGARHHDVAIERLDLLDPAARRQVRVILLGNGGVAA